MKERKLRVPIQFLLHEHHVSLSVFPPFFLLDALLLHFVIYIPTTPGTLLPIYLCTVSSSYYILSLYSSFSCLLCIQFCTSLFMLFLVDHFFPYLSQLHFHSYFTLFSFEALVRLFVVRGYDSFLRFSKRNTSLSLFGFVREFCSSGGISAKILSLCLSSRRQCIHQYPNNSNVYH